jgi:hypothetical protein
MRSEVGVCVCACARARACVCVCVCGILSFCLSVLPIVNYKFIKMVFLLELRLLSQSTQTLKKEAWHKRFSMNLAFFMHAWNITVHAGKMTFFSGEERIISKFTNHKLQATTIHLHVYKVQSPNHEIIDLFIINLKTRWRTCLNKKEKKKGFGIPLIKTFNQHNYSSRENNYNNTQDPRYKICLLPSNKTWNLSQHIITRLIKLVYLFYAFLCLHNLPTARNMPKMRPHMLLLPFNYLC